MGCKHIRQCFWEHRSFLLILLGPRPSPTPPRRGRAPGKGWEGGARDSEGGQRQPAPLQTFQAVISFFLVRKGKDNAGLIPMPLENLKPRNLKLPTLATETDFSEPMSGPNLDPPWVYLGYILNLSWAQSWMRTFTCTLTCAFPCTLTCRFLM